MAQYILVSNHLEYNDYTYDQTGGMNVPSEVYETEGAALIARQHITCDIVWSVASPWFNISDYCFDFNEEQLDAAIERVLGLTFEQVIAGTYYEDMDMGNLHSRINALFSYLQENRGIYDNGHVIALFEALPEMYRHKVVKLPYAPFREAIVPVYSASEPSEVITEVRITDAGALF